MGCGESKHAVATANTVSKSSSKRSRSIKTLNLENNATTVEKRLKSTNVDGNVNAMAPVQENGNVVKDSGNENVNEKEIPDAVEEEPEADIEEKPENGDWLKNENVGAKEKGVDEHGNAESGIDREVEETPKVAAAVNAVDEKKEEGKNEELKELGEEKGDRVINVDREEEQEEERLMVSHDSSNHLFSPKKDHHEETIESIIPDGISGESDHYLPHARQHVPEGEDGGDDASKGKEMNGEAESSAEKEEAIIVDDGKDVVPVDETEGSASATAKGEEETPVSEKENANATTS